MLFSSVIKRHKRMETIPTRQYTNRFITYEDLPNNIKNCSYAVRGKIPSRAQEITKEMELGKKFPFEKVVFCNIGNPQELRQKPITFGRQVLSGVEYPALLESEYAQKIFPKDVIARVNNILKHVPSGTGAYSESKGIGLIRKEVSRFIRNRDLGSQSQIDTETYSPYENIFLSNGASQAITDVLALHIGSENDGIMIPIPQYPLYSASITSMGGVQLPYYLDEANDWALSYEELERSFQESMKSNFAPRALVIINPGNPTGKTLPKENIQSIIEFCYDKKISLLADEVYQENVYHPDVKQWHSFKKVKHEMGSKYKDLPLFSFNSVSKGLYGECGKRGGYVEVDGVEKAVLDEFYKICSVRLCPNILGQVMLSCVVNPPVKGDESYELYMSERETIYQSMKRRAKILTDTLAQLEGVHCTEIDGAMYAFPKITLSEKAIEKAKSVGLQPDVLYCLELLEQTGLCVVPGSGFGQKDGTFHFRTTFLPQEEELETVLKSYKKFHDNFMDTYR